MCWERYNAKIIMSVGMGWDTGAPMWPYQTPEIFVATLNAPAFVIAAPVWIAFNLQTMEQRQPAILLATVVLWFLVGRSVDEREFRRQYNRSTWVRALLIGVAVIAAAIGTFLIKDGARWWPTYDQIQLSSLLILMRKLAAVPWCMAIAILGTRLAIRRRG
jgi:hypothetical protein